MIAFREVDAQLAAGRLPPLGLLLRARAEYLATDASDWGFQIGPPWVPAIFYDRTHLPKPVAPGDEESPEPEDDQ